MEVERIDGSLVQFLNTRALPEAEVLVVTQSEQRARDIREATGGLLSGVRVTNPSSLALSIVRKDPTFTASVSPHYISHLIARLAEQHSSEMGLLGQTENYSGIVGSLREFISDTVTNRPETIPSFLKDGGVGVLDGAPYGDRLGPFLARYLKATYCRGIYDRDLTYYRAVEILTESSTTIYRTLVFDGLHSQPALLCHLDEALVSNSASAYVSLDDYDRRLEIPTRGELSGIRKAYASRSLEHILGDDLQKREPILRLTTRRDEVISIARLIKTMRGNDQDLDLSSFVIAAADLGRYRGILEEVLTSYGIPFRMQNGPPLTSIPIFGLLNRLLTLISGSFDREELFAFFSSRLVDSGGIDITMIDEAARVRGLNELSRLRKQVLDEGKADAALVGQLDSLESFLRRLPEVSDFRPSAFVKGFTELIGDIRVAENLVGLGEFQEEARDGLKALGMILQLLQDSAEIMESVSPNGRSHSYEEFVRLFLDMARGARVGADDVGEAVEVCSISEARLLQPKVCALLGLVEGEFPPEKRSGFLTSSSSASSEDLEIEALHSLISILRRSERVILSAPESGEGDTLTLSPFLIGSAGSDSRAEAAPVLDMADNSSEILFFSEYEFETGIQRSCDRLAVSSEPKGTTGLRLLTKPEDVFVRALAVHGFREKAAQRSEFEGILSKKSELIEEKPYAVTALECYVRCPFKYLLRYIYRVKPVQAVVEDMEASDIGSLVHSILCEFGSEGGFDLLRRDRDGADILMADVAEKVLERDLDTHFHQNPFAEARYTGLVRGLRDKAEEPGLLRRFLDYEAKRKREMLPTRFESWIRLGIASQGVSAAVTGKVDRIDVAADGHTVMVVDYKTGLCPSRKDAELGLDLQMPLYILGTLGEPEFKGAESVSGAYCQISQKKIRYSGEYSFSEAQSEKGTQPKGRSATDLGEAEETIRSIGELISRLERGEFSTTEVDESKAGCSYCDYRTICRHSER